MNSRQLQPFNTVQSLTPLGKMKAFSLLWTLNSAFLESTCVRNPHQERSPSNQIAYDEGDGGPGFLTPDAITLLGLLTLAVLLIRLSIFFYIPLAISYQILRPFEIFVLVQVYWGYVFLRRNTIGILDTSAR